ncbi:glycosyltransferase [Cupriavidus sp. 2KB_3]|uniref:glycosyltransferase n=1 Tax=Cupriavidus sp. 2KB_3 TaxID=3232980 RepID=UPI003F8FC938
MRILFLITGLRLGGAEQQVAALANTFARGGHAVSIVSLTAGQEVTLDPRIGVLALDMRKTPWSMLAALAAVRRLVRQWQPDIIHAHMVHANLFARVLARLGGCPPVICSAHSAQEGGRIRMLAYRVTDGWDALTTHVSAVARQTMIDGGAVRAQRFEVVPNGIDVERFRPDPALRAQTRAAFDIDAHTPVILNVGRLVPEKDQDTLLHAFAQIVDQTGARLLIAGEGPERRALESSVAGRPELAGRVTLLGARGDVPALLNAADLFVLSSRVEGMPLVIGEAMACGLPVVATDAPGVEELLGSRTHIVPVCNADALAQAIGQALHVPPGGAIARRQRIEREFSLAAVAQRWLGIYARLARARPAPLSTTGKAH